MLTDSDVKMGKEYDLQVILEECKCTVKEKKISTFINDELKIYSNKLDEVVADEKK